jgi:hypothetical protein
MVRYRMRSKKYYSFIQVMICILVLSVMYCIHNDISGGSGAETGNAKVAGIIVDASGKPASNVIVAIYPAFYNPITGTPSEYPLIDTTGISGEYNFIVPGKGSYTILAKDPITNDNAIVSAFNVEDENSSIPNSTLKKTGAIRINYTPEVEMKPGNIFIPGTSIRVAIDSIDIVAGFITIEAVPEGLLGALFFSTINGDYVTSIAEGISVKSEETTVTDVCLCSNAAKGYDADPPVAIETQYRSFGGTNLTLNSWKGEHVALLTKRANLDPCIMRRILSVMDSGYIFNKNYLGQSPPIDKHYKGLLSIAESPYAEGIYNGLIGVTGIEIGEDQFTRIYNLVATKNSLPQELFFVFSNNFNFYMNRLAFSSNVKFSITVARGFSVYMRFITMEGLGIEADPIMNHTLAQYREKIESLMDLYVADTSLRFNNTFALDTLSFSDLNPEHLYASLLMKLGKLYGSTFLENIWKEVDKRPAATSTQMSIDNLIISSSIAAKSDLTQLFITWKLPVSESAKQEVSKLFP